MLEDSSYYGDTPGSSSLFTRYRRPFVIGGAVAGLLVVAVVATAVVLSVTMTQLDDSSGSSSSYSRPKNIIFMIGDGFGPVSATFAREIQDVNDPDSLLIIDTALKGHISTKSASSLVTDSAAGATAYSCASKTTNRYVGVLPDGTPCGTLMEAAMMQGMRGGLVATSRITHATPASFSAHVRERDDEELIAEQQLNFSKPQVMLGGGLEEFDPKLRSDGKDLLKQAEDLGYSVVMNVSSLMDADSLPLLGLFADGHIPYAIDRRGSTVIPTLANMTTKALELLNRNNEDGFFLMVEGSRIDMASHQNDPGAHYYAIQGYMDAIKVATDFAAEDGRTLVVSVADHETGGISLGCNKNDGSYPDYLWHPEQVLKQTASAEAIFELAMAGETDIETLLSEYAGVADLTPAEKAALEAAVAAGGRNAGARAVGKVVSYRDRVGWTSWGHTGVDINMYVWADDTGATAPLHNRVSENSALGARLFEFLGLDQQAANEAVKDIPVEPSAAAKRQRLLQGHRHHAYGYHD